MCDKGELCRGQGIEFTRTTHAYDALRRAKHQCLHMAQVSGVARLVKNSTKQR